MIAKPPMEVNIKHEVEQEEATPPYLSLKLRVTKPLSISPLMVLPY